MIYTTDFPVDNPVEAKRLGYRLPRSILLPPYLAFNPFFIDWLDAVDSVFDESVDGKINIIKNIRNMWVENPELERKILNKEMISQSDWSLPEQDIVLHQLNMLGLQLGVPTILFDNEAFVSISRYLGMYWFEKGLDNFMDFVNFCCKTNYVIRNCWTKDYKEFYMEGEDEIGTPIWEGGEWFPTTHIKFRAINASTADINLISQLFYEIANYNLVLYSIESIYNLDLSGGKGLGYLGVYIAGDYNTRYTLYTKGFKVNV